MNIVTTYTYTRENSNCSKCFLSYRNIVKGVGAYHGRIIFLGEAPGQEEDKQGVPFVGRAGKTLDKMLWEVHINRYKNWVTNRIYCRPLDNNFSGSDAIIASRYCKEGLFDELYFLKENGYTIIVPLGNNALRAFSMDGIGQYRGRVIQEHDFGFTLVPTYHPSYIIRNIGKLEECEDKDIWRKWKKDFEKIKEIINER